MMGKEQGELEGREGSLGSNYGVLINLLSARQGKAAGSGGDRKTFKDQL